MIRGLVLRNEEKFPQAVPVLKKATAALADTPGTWLKQAEEALSEVSNPGAGVARKVNTLMAEGQHSEALALLNRRLKVVSGPKGALYAKRALLSLEAARAKGPLAGSDPLVVSARRDAAAAVKEGVAEGYYAAGRLAEELGQMDAAITNYRAAVEAHTTMDAAGSRYRVALARALIKSRSGETPAIRPLPPPDRTGKAPLKRGKPAKTTAVARSLSVLDFVSLLMVMTFQAEDLPLTGPKVREAEKLADEILKMGDKAPFDVRAQALAVKGLYTRALLVYTAGLRENRLLAPAYANALLDLINNHPMLKRPESLAIPEPAVGEKHYAAGLNFFFGRNYADAEKEFLSAIENDNGDARYYYFLGLSRLAQGKRAAAEDFDQAARLERLGRPDRATVSRALERVQGPLRRVLNEIRSRPVKDRAK
jgi:tetratricopeptide (TPR) repeat protein